MSYDLGAFAAALMGDPVLALIVVLTLGATVVNGATDAPNAIATVVGTKAMRPGPAIAMAAVCNFVGLAAITMVSSAVALTIFKMVDFGGDNQAALIALAAAMVAIIVWGVTAWYFGIPTSQSHSLIAGITGAASEAGLNIENLVNKSRKDVAYTMLDVSGNVGGGVVARLKGLEGCIRVRII